jgi:hypothetical protein
VYEERLATRTRELAEAEKRADLIGNLRLGLALVALILVILPLFTRGSGPWWSLIGVGLVFLILGKQHDRASDRARRLRAAVRFHQESLDRLSEKWRAFADDGADLPDSLKRDALYSDDLDLFGPASLFQLLSRSATHLGRRRLAQLLVAPAEQAEIEQRQAAVKELAPMLDVREELITSAAGDDASPLDDKHLLDWAEKLPPIPNAGLFRLLGIVLPIVTTASIIFVWWNNGRFAIVLLVAALLHGGTMFAARRLFGDRADILSGPDRALSRYASLIGAIEKFPLKAPLLVDLKQRMAGEKRSASEEIAKLHSIVNYLDARLNAFFGLSIGILTMWELNWVLAAERFRETTGKKLSGWLAAIAELEAIGSLAGLLYDRPDYSLPQIDADPSAFAAESLSHPLIDRRRVVGNDLTLGGAGSVLLLSGSNMSGKSTLLRAVGIAYVLARAGGPVAAKSLSIGTMRLATSVRIVDSLAHGTSHFYAELKRLKHIVDLAKAEDRPLLYLLDEMLHGTNSRERFIGAVSVIRWLSERGAIGIVTTHDLSLARIEGELPKGRVINRHFSDEVSGDQIRFDYRLRDGQVSSTNAIRLMRAVGIDVEYRELSP